MTRYIVKDARTAQSTDLLNKIREPWQLIDTTTNQIVDEFLSKNAANGWAKDLNRGGTMPGYTPR